MTLSLLSPIDQETAKKRRLALTDAQSAFLQAHGISISDGYIGMLRAYKDNRTVWQTSALAVYVSAHSQDISAYLKEADVANPIALRAWIDELMALAPDELVTRLEVHVPLFSIHDPLVSGSMGRDTPTDLFL